MDKNSYESAKQQLYAEVVKLGYPSELGTLLIKELRTELAINRMSSYLRNAKPRSMEEIADEMLAIAQQRDSWIAHKVSERANATVTQWYNRSE